MVKLTPEWIPAYVTRGKIPKDSADEFFDFIVRRLPEQTNQTGNASRVLDGTLVLVVLSAV